MFWKIFAGNWDLSRCLKWSALRADSAADAAQGKPPLTRGLAKIGTSEPIFDWGRDIIAFYSNISDVYAFLSLSQLR